MELELGSGDEWEKLCRPLEKDIPVGREGKAKQYPRVNDKAFFMRFEKGCYSGLGCRRRRKCSGMARCVDWCLQRVLGATLSGRVGSLVAVAATRLALRIMPYTATLASCITSRCSGRVEWQIRPEVLVGFI